MLGATLQRSFTAGLDGLKPVWKIRPKDIVDVDGVSFIKVNPANVGLHRLVCAKNPNAPKGLTTLSVNAGLKELLRLRNRAQAASLDAANAEQTCFLFETPPKKKAKPVKSRPQIQEMRASPESLTVAIVTDDDVEHHVKVLRPVHPSDCIPLFSNIGVRRCQTCENFALAQGHTRPIGCKDAIRRNVQVSSRGQTEALQGSG